MILLLPEYYKNVHVTKHLIQRQTYDHNSWLGTGACGKVKLVKWDVNTPRLVKGKNQRK